MGENILTINIYTKFKNHTKKKFCDGNIFFKTDSESTYNCLSNL